jgi:hypothetical protein
VASSIVQFVDSIGASPTVRLDLNSRTVGLMVKPDGIDLSPPGLRRATSQTLLTDGARVTAAAYDNRVVKLPIQLVPGLSTDAAALLVQKLGRELDRPTNILKIQLTGATNPIFFRTLRDSYALQMMRLRLAVNTQTMLALPAEPFAYGLRQTAVNAATLAANPASANGCLVDITAGTVLGDVEAPCDITIDSTHLFDSSMKPKSAFAVRRRGTPSSAPFLLQAESMTMGTNTTVQTNDANFSGAGSNYVRCTFGTTSMVGRVSKASFPSATPGVDIRGMYRVFARVRTNTGGDVVKVQFQAALGASTVVNDAVTVPGSVTVNQLVDLGLVTFPYGPDPIYDGISGVELAVDNTSVTVQLNAQRVSGSGSLDIDYLLFVPADDAYCVVDWANETSSTLTAHVDGNSETVWAATAAGNLASFPVSTLAGRFMRLSPAVAQRLYFIPVIGQATTETIGFTYTVSAYYYPRYLVVRPATT